MTDDQRRSIGEDPNVLLDTENTMAGAGIPMGPRISVYNLTTFINRRHGAIGAWGSRHSYVDLEKLAKRWGKD